MSVATQGKLTRKAAIMAINGPIIPPIVSPTSPVVEKSILNHDLVVIRYGRNPIKNTRIINGINQVQILCIEVGLSFWFSIINCRFYDCQGIGANGLALGAVADFGAQNCQYTTKVDAR